KEPYGLSYLCGNRIIPGQRTDTAVKDDVIGLFVQRLLHIEGLEAPLPISALGIKIALHNVVLFIYQWQTSFGLYQDQSVHAITYMHPHGSGRAMIYIKSGI